MVLIMYKLCLLGLGRLNEATSYSPATPSALVCVDRLNCTLLVRALCDSRDEGCDFECLIHKSFADLKCAAGQAYKLSPLEAVLMICSSEDPTTTKRKNPSMMGPTFEDSFLPPRESGTLPRLLTLP